MVKNDNNERREECSATNDEFIFFGKIHPERAHLSFAAVVKLDIDGRRIPMEIRVFENQLTATVDGCGFGWDVDALASTIKRCVHAAILPHDFFFGMSRNVELVRIVNTSRNYDWTLGADVAGMFERYDAASANEFADAASSLSNGPSGELVAKSMRMFTLAMRSDEDVGALCWLAVDSLRRRHAEKNGLEKESEEAQWASFAEYAGCGMNAVADLLVAAAPKKSPPCADERKSILLLAASVVEGYIGKEAVAAGLLRKIPQRKITPPNSPPFVL